MTQAFEGKSKLMTHQLGHIQCERHVPTFYNAPSFNQSIGKGNSKRLMQNMFRSASSFNQPIGDWNTSSVVSLGTHSEVLLDSIRTLVMGHFRCHHKNAFKASSSTSRLEPVKLKSSKKDRMFLRPRPSTKTSVIGISML